MKYDKLFISDVHLGTKASQTKLLKKFLETIEFEELYLVGDIIDIWALKKRIYWNKSHNEIIRLFLKIAKKKKVYYILGNHDEAIRKFIPIDLGNIEICNYKRFVWNTKIIYVLHGDQFDFIINKFPVIAWIGTWLYDLIIYLNVVVSWLREKFGFPYWSISKYLKEKAKSSFGILEKYKEHISRFAERKEIDLIIFGHLHMPKIEQKNDVLMANTGDWVENCSAIGIIDNKLNLLEYDRKLNNWKISNNIEF